MSLAQKGKPKPQYSHGGNPHAKSVLCIETNIVYETVKDAADSVNIHSSGIIQAIKNNGTCRNFHWSYL